MAFLTLAYPTISEFDTELIQSFRKQYDKLYDDVVLPHFTLVFAVSNWNRDEFIEEIKHRSKKFKRFKFELRKAIVCKDDFKDYYHVFLVVDEGDNEIINLHDRLYSGRLIEHWRTDIDYIPHITLGNSKSEKECLEMASIWNAQKHLIKGEVSKISVVEYNDVKVEEITSFELIKYS